MGDAAYNQLSGNGTITGTQTSPLALPLPLPLPSLPAITPGTQDVYLSHSASETLDPGSYAAITLANGNGGIPTVLSLTGGLYQMTKLEVGHDARVVCLAPCELRIAGRLLILARSSVGPADTPGLGAGNVELLVAGTNATSHPTSTPAAATIDNDAGIEAYLLAPNGTARFGQRGTLTGKVVARDVLFALDGEGIGQQLPLITQHPSDLTVDQGDPAEFTVTATGTSLSYQWQRAGLDIPGATSASYLLPSATEADNGATFRVIVSCRRAGSATQHGPSAG